MRECAALVLILVSLAVPVASTAVPDDSRQAYPTVINPEFNVTGADIANNTIPARYAASPTLIDVGVEISDTSMPGPKGEMQAGPRAIGFAADPVVILILAVAILAGAAGVWYLVKRKQEEPDEQDRKRGE